MGAVRGTLFFYDQTSYVPTGWSETHFLRALDTPLPTALSLLRDMGALRQAMLAPGIQVAYCRVSDDGTYRDSLIAPGLNALTLAQLNAEQFAVQGTQPVQNGNQGPSAIALNPLYPNDPSDMAWTAILMRGQGPAPYVARSMFWISGIPDGLTFASNRGITQSVWLQAFSFWKAEMITNWGFFSQNNTSSNPFRPITNVAQPAGVVVITCQNHGFQSGQLVGIRGVKTISNNGKLVNKVWQVIVIDPNSFQLIGSSTVPAFTYLMGGTAQLRTKVVTPYADILQRRFGSRKRGRPFGLLTGKQRAKKPA